MLNYDKILLPANGTFPDGASGRRRTALTQWPFSYASPWPERNEISNSYYYRKLIFHGGHYVGKFFVRFPSK